MTFCINLYFWFSQTSCKEWNYKKWNFFVLPLLGCNHFLFGFRTHWNAPMTSLALNPNFPATESHTNWGLKGESTQPEQAEWVELHRRRTRRREKYWAQSQLAHCVLSQLCKVVQNLCKSHKLLIEFPFFHISINLKSASKKVIFLKTLFLTRF